MSAMLILPVATTTCRGRANSRSAMSPSASSAGGAEHDVTATLSLLCLRH
jgi:hypothetical protein